MTHIGIEIAVALATASAAALAAVYELSLSREARLRRKEASRFPMFAVRDHLVELVARGEIDPNEGAWAMTYSTVNGLLNLHQRLRLDDVIKQYIGFAVAEFAVPAVRLRSQKIKKEIERAQKRCPSFGKVLREMEQAFRAMVQMRTGFWSTVCLRLFLWRLTLPEPLRPNLVIQFSPAQSPAIVDTKAKPSSDGVRKVRKSLRKPQSGEPFERILSIGGLLAISSGLHRRQDRAWRWTTCTDGASFRPSSRSRVTVAPACPDCRKLSVDRSFARACRPSKDSSPSTCRPGSNGTRFLW